ncbi:MAG: bifunctional adenosylcobinamide kinase/adenosylcobinamide-phosphate guanylyltransferase [Butyrivibrio sp.]|nr:bifunctional adenosylcobinamide kinase/adenosylcobinamide-phosphate guanylyltransferase [Butyrivibrio sp.]
MIYLVLGTSNSGKSAFAEELSMKTGDPVRLYLATMKVCDEEGTERVKRHRRQRRGKGFVTIEAQYNIQEAAAAADKPEDTTVLLECVSNLVANELYENPLRRHPDHDLSADEADKMEDSMADEIAEEIKRLAFKVHNLVIVSNEYDKDGENYDDSTRRYVRMLSKVNDRIKAFSDKIFDLRKVISESDRQKEPV